MKPVSKLLLALALGLFLVAGFQPAAGQDLPPSLPDAGGAAEAVTAVASPTPSFGRDPKKREQDESNFKSLEETYEYELKLMDEEKYAVDYELADVESKEYDLWTRVKAFTQTPNVSLHGLGRAVGISQQYYGHYSNFKFNFPSDRFEKIFMDFEPIVVVSKEVRMSGIIRWESSLIPGIGQDQFFPRRLRMDLQPEFLTVSIGDFEEAYTPFTLWNRNNLDLNYKPEMVARIDNYSKFEDFYDREPAWPFRGVHLETALGWPDSGFLELWRTSAFAHMIENGFDNNSTFKYFGNPTDWIFSAHTELKSKRWYSGSTSWQAFLDGYGIVLDEPVGSDPARVAIYKSNLVATWFHQYRIWSFKPMMRVGVGDDIYLGAQVEGSLSDFQDDKFNGHSTVSDSALRGGPFLQMGSSKISFNYLNVGPHFYSPLAQTRQDNVTPVTLTAPSTPISVAGGVPDLFQAPLRNFPLATTTITPGTIFFLPNVPRAGAIFGFYDRTTDNTFPYGLATPNRQGVGVDMDIKTLKKYSLKIKGSLWFVNEIGGNTVIQPNAKGGPVTAAVDSATITAGAASPYTYQIGVTPVRNFTYVNIGPSFDFGPSLDLTTPIEIGANARYEQTSSAVGTLTSTWLLGGLRVGFFPGVEATVAYSERDFNGAEEGYFPFTGNAVKPQPFTTPLARYSYLNDPSDLGFYRIFQMNGNNQSLLYSLAIEVNRNSKLYFDYSLTQGTEIVNVGPVLSGAVPGTLYNQYMGGTYDIKF